MSSRRSRRRREQREESLGESLRTFALALGLALLIRTLLLQTFYVPSGSMFETLLLGDHVFVNKVLYGIRIPGTEIRLPGLREPARGDVVVFKAARAPHGRVVPADRRTDLPREDFIKRIVGVPGDLVEYSLGHVQRLAGLAAADSRRLSRPDAAEEVLQLVFQRVAFGHVGAGQIGRAHV